MTPRETYGPLPEPRAMGFDCHGSVTCKVCARAEPRRSRTQTSTCGRDECKRAWAKRRKVTA